MFSKLEIAAAVTFLALAALLLGLWSWVAGPRLWSELDLRVALGSLALTWVGVAWALPNRRSHLDPEGT